METRQMRRAAERQATKDLNRKQLPEASPDEIPEIRSEFHRENVARAKGTGSAADQDRTPVFPGGHGVPVLRVFNDAAIIDARMAEEAELDKLPEAEREAERIERRILKYERIK
jgi:hypothetical protein